MMNPAQLARLLQHESESVRLAAIRLAPKLLIETTEAERFLAERPFRPAWQVENDAMLTTDTRRIATVGSRDLGFWTENKAVAFADGSLLEFGAYHISPCVDLGDVGWYSPETERLVLEALPF
jgi:hypothetical protein